MKKFLATFLAFAMVLSMLCLPAVAAEGLDDGIDTLQDLKDAIAAAVTAGEGTVTLEADLEVTVDSAEDLPLLGDVTAPITIDGAGHKITITTSGTAPVISTSNTGYLFKTFQGTLKNLTVDGIQYSQSVANVAAFAGTAPSSGTTKLENVHLEHVSILDDATASSVNIGGFFPKNGNGALDFKNCSIEGSITIDTTSSSQAASAGGYIGKGSGSGSMTFTNCTNAVDVIYVSGTKRIEAGGFIGNNASCDVFMTNCVNTGDIAGGWTGGFIGKGLAHITITGCVNLGEISLVATSGGDANKNIVAGGIMGGNDEVSSGTVSINDCLNFGAVNTAAAGGSGTVTVDAIVADTGDATLVATNNINFVDGLTGGTAAIAGSTYTLNSALLTTDLTMDGTETGARMRLSNTLSNAGIRYDIGAGKTALDALAALGDVTVGSAVMKDPGSKTAAEIITAGNALEKAYSDLTIKADGTYSISIKNIASGDYAVDYVAVAYLEVTIGENTYTIVTELSDARNVAEIAHAAIENDSELYTNYIGEGKCLTEIAKAYAAE